MKSVSGRSLLFAVGVAAGCAAGCGGEGARVFSVVLSEPEFLDCTLVLPPSAGVNVEVAAQVFASTTTDWRARWDAGLLRPVGGELHLLSEGETAQGYFSQLPPGQEYFWNGKVFEGEAPDGYVEMSLLESFEADSSECGEVIVAESTLLATLEGAEIDGRVRRVERIYIASQLSYCEAYLECARNIALEGAKE